MQPHRSDQPEPDEANRWQARPLLAAGLTLLVVAVPVVASLVTAWLFSALLPTGTGSGRWGYRIITVIAALVAALLAERAARRLLPMTALLKLSLLFPDQAPSRFKVARRATSADRLSELSTKRKSDTMNAATTIVELLAALANHDKRTRGHAERVRVYTDLLAEQLRLGRDDQDLLRWGALLHDIGKLSVDPDILNKAGKPSDREWNILRSHPEQGAKAAAVLLPWLGEWGSAIVEHHERFDGTGYPNGLAGTAISRAGRVIAVVDAFEVMTAARSYKRPMSTGKAREELASCAGSHFDPVMVRAFLGISLPRLLWATGPLSFLVQLPFIGLFREAGTKLAGAGLPAVAAATGVAVVAVGPGATVSAARTPQPPRSPVVQPSAPKLDVKTKTTTRTPSAAAVLGPAALPISVPLTSVIARPQPVAAAPVEAPPIRDVPRPPAAPVVAPTPTALPALRVTSGPVRTSSATDAVVAFDTTGATTVTCSLDGGAASPCIDSWSGTNLGLGAHTLTITAANDAGSTTVAYQWTVASPPAPPISQAAAVITVTSGPVASSSATDAAVTFDVSDPAATVTCSLDSGASAPCTNSWSGTNLAVGTHTLTIYATNAGGIGTASYSWTVTAPPVAVPSVSITNGPSPSSEATDAAVNFLVSDPAANVICSLDNGIPTACANSWSASNLSVGTHTLNIDATNSAGTGSASYTWDVTAPPPPPIGAPTVTPISGPVPSSTATTAVVAFSVSDPAASITCSLDGGPAATCTSPWIDNNVPVGSHTLTIAATNAGGTGTATYSWTVTAPPVPTPVVTITSGPVASSAATTATVNFSVSDPAATITCQLDGGAQLGCTNPWSKTNLAVGSHTLTIRATNASGTGTASYNWTVTPAPLLPDLVTLLSKPAAQDSTKKATFTWSQTPGLTYQCSLDGAAFTNCTSGITYTNVKNGIHTFRVHSTGSLGLSGLDAVYTWKAT